MDPGGGCVNLDFIRICNLFVFFCLGASNVSELGGLRAIGLAPNEFEDVMRTDELVLAGFGIQHGSDMNYEQSKHVRKFVGLCCATFHGKYY